MSESYIRRLLVLGVLAVTGIIFIQSFWVIKTWDLKDDEFDHTVRIALRNVAESLAEFNQSDLPKQNLIKRRSSNYYAVNINSAINANVLEDYLYRELTAKSLNSDFEYAVFDCASQNMVYGNYCQLSDKPEDELQPEGNLPSFDDLIYYFVVKFPNRSGYLLANMPMSIMFSLISLLVILYFAYTTWIIVRQKRLTEMQKDFINNMTHEFKTPISSIKIAADVIKRDKSVAINPRLSRYADIITDQNARLNSQVEKVLSLAKMEKEGFQLNRDQFDPHEVLHDIINSENLRIARVNKGTIVKTFAQASIKITADKLHFSNVIYNILDNAVKYSDTTADIVVTTAIKDQKLTITIRDHGIGITKEELPKLFTKFYRVPTGNIHNVKGFGLGLYYVKNIADAHRWQIQLDSEAGEGTTFKIIIKTDE